MKPRYLIVGALVYLLALAVLAPATALVWVARLAGQGSVTLEGVSGSLWHGHAERLAIRPGKAPPVRLTGVDWQLMLQRLLWGGALVRIANQGGDAVLCGGVLPLPSGLQLTDAHAEIPLARFASFSASPVAAGLTGVLRLDSADIRLAAPFRGKAKGELRITGGKLPAGTYDLDFEGAGTRLNFRWHGPHGPRAMSGGGWWDGALHLDGVPGAISR